MNSHDATRLMHAVLDGEATPAESRDLERLLAADPALASRYEEWRRLFDAMGRMPKAYPPEGLVAAVMANIPQTPANAGQLSTQSGVIGVGSNAIRETIPAPILRRSRSMESLGGFTMSEQINPANKRKIWIGAGVAAVAIVAVGGFMLDKPATDVQGTILPVQRVIAPQNTAVDIQPNGVPFKPRTEPLPVDPAAAQAQGQARGQAEGQARGQAEGQARGQAEGQARGQAEGQARGQAEGQARGQAEGQARGQAEGQARGQAEGQAKGQARGQAEGQARGQAEGQARGQAEGQARGQAEGQARGQAEGQAKGQARGQAEGQAKSMAAGQAKSTAQ